MFSDEPGEAWPALEVYNVILALFLGESPGSVLAGQGHADVQTAQQEPYLLTTWILTTNNKQQTK